MDTAGWNSAVTGQSADRDIAYVSEFPNDPAARLFQPYRVTVTLWTPDRKRSVKAVLFGDGRPASWESRPPVSASIADAAILDDFLSASRPSFQAAPAPSEGNVLWNWSSGPNFPLTAALTIERKSGSLASVSLAPKYDERFNPPGKRSELLDNLTTLPAFVQWLAAALACFWFIIRRRFHYRIPLVIVAVQTLWAVITAFSVPLQLYLEARAETSVGNSLLRATSGQSGEFFAIVSFFVFAGAGLGLRTPGNRHRWVPFDLVSRRRILNRVVGWPLALGALGGIALAALPYVIGAMRLPAGALTLRWMRTVMSPFPLADAVRLSGAVLPLAVLGFLLPLSQKVRPAPLRWILFGSAGALILADQAPFRGVAPTLVYGVLFVAALVLLWQRGGVMAALVAVVFSRALIVPCILLAQPISTLRESGIRLLAVLLAAAAAAVHLALRGKEPDAHSAEFVSAYVPEKSDRERLEAEFEVARKAQQNALPAAPPDIPGYSFSGSCRPAQQVGGDLYDYFPLPDGRLGIAVADVSGKGVPAALYMMMTKGLLGALTADGSDLSYILEQINLHLYRACKRKVFVTMAAAVLDAPRNRLQYGRAGHNPMVWRRTRRRETLVLKPPGLGLGMTPAERFARTLRVEELELEPDDAIVLYSDGVTEAVNETMDQYGEQRLLRAVERTDGQSAAASHDTILHDLNAFMGAAPPRDDITLVVIRAA